MSIQIHNQFEKTKLEKDLKKKEEEEKSAKVRSMNVISFLTVILGTNLWSPKKN